MAKEKSASVSIEDGRMKESIGKELRRLQKALATLSCLKVALAEESCDEIDCEDVASVVRDLLAKAIPNLDGASSSRAPK
jgi:hypothetical protein